MYRETDRLVVCSYEVKSTTFRNTDLCVGEHMGFEEAEGGQLRGKKA